MSRVVCLSFNFPKKFRLKPLINVGFSRGRFKVQVPPRIRRQLLVSNRFFFEDQANEQ